jgi:large subunit ribosomal protein L17
MRHKISGNRLSRNKSLRKATLRDLAKATLIDQRICTTSAKAKEARKLVEKLITLGKKDTLAARRRAFAILCDHSLVSSLFKETAPRFKARTGGYTRIIPFNNRIGDNAKMVFLELTEKDRAIISGQKIKKSTAADTTVEDAQTKPVADTKAAKPEHSKADVKTATKTAAKPTGVKKLFQRKTGAE